MKRRERNGRTKRQFAWIRWLAGTLAVVGVVLLIAIGPGAILSVGESETSVVPGDEPTTTAHDMADASAQEEEETRLTLPSIPTAPPIGLDTSLSQPYEVGGDFSADRIADGISTRSERIDLEQIRQRLQSGERAEDINSDPGWEHEIAVGRRGSLRIGYEPAGGSEARDPLSGTLEAELVVDLFGKASVSAGYRLLNFRDLEGNQELRDALARAQVQVRF